MFTRNWCGCAISGQKCALATIVQVRGSIPSYESAKILVREDGSMIGTIGGGCVEAEVWNAAREVIAHRKAAPPELQPGAGCRLRQRPDLRRATGRVRGAGAARAARLSSSAPATFRRAFRRWPRWPDSPASWSTTAKPSPTANVFRRPAKCTPASTRRSSRTGDQRNQLHHHRHARASRRHAGAELAVATPARYIAMIGSKRKVLNVMRELEKEGIPRTAFERIHAPMGLDIGAISPEEIAISVTAEMIAVRRNAASNWRSLSMSILADEAPRAVLEK